MSALDRPTDPIDISSHAFWQQSVDDRDAAFAELRRDRPISWHGPPETNLVEPEEATGGYWALARHKEVREISRDNTTFCSGQGVILDDVPPEMLELSQSFLAMDPPRHTKIRGLVNAAFTPRQVRRIEDQIAANARRVVDDVKGLGTCDAVEHIASRLPLMTISSMVGVPEEDQEEFMRLADEIVGWNDPDLVGDQEPIDLIFSGVMGLNRLAFEMRDARRREPADDLMTALTEAEVDGQQLKEEEIGAFIVLLAVAGNDTTRHATSHGMYALTRFPEQREILLADLPGTIDTAVEEIVRWASPVMTFRRTATKDTEILGRPVAEGEKVLLLYPSANRDEAAFADPFQFDVRREPNHHVGFGGGGVHYCLGASLARTQLRAIFTEILTNIPDFDCREPVPLVGNFINGIKRMEVEFTPRA